MPRQLTREALYELVWSKPKTALAKEFGMSDVALGKVCAKAQVPVPPRGYWAARAAGKRVQQTPLTRRGLGESGRVDIGPAAGWRYNEPVGELPPSPDFPESLEVVLDRAKKQVGTVVARSSLANPHPVVARLLTADEERRKAAANGSLYLASPKFDVPPAKRRLRLINALFLALSRAGCYPSCRGDEAEELCARVGHQAVAFSLMPVKPSRRRDRIFGPTDTKARQPLRLTVTARCPCPTGLTMEWQDSETEPLENHLRDIIVHILVFGELQYRARVIEHHEWLVERKRQEEDAAREARERAERERREALLRQEAERRDRLFEQVQNWRRAADIRAFVAAIQDHPETRTHPDALANWVAWALSQADALDATEGPLSDVLNLADDVDRSSSRA